jgi:alkylated DNA repair protein (DNA oxidative demethylase)
MRLVSNSGFDLWPGRLDPAAQRALLAETLLRLEGAPLYRAVTTGGKTMSVQNSNFGPLGWVSDAAGYRYQPTHPVTGRPWPDIPPALLALWADLADPDHPPDACLVNLYRDGARLGLHQDRDETDFRWPVLSVSLGDIAVFRLGGQRRNEPTRSLRLSSGDVCRLAGEARLAFHGVDRTLAGSSTLIPDGGRINLTLRRSG